MLITDVFIFAADMLKIVETVNHADSAPCKVRLEWVDIVLQGNYIFKENKFVYVRAVDTQSDDEPASVKFTIDLNKRTLTTVYGEHDFTLPINTADKSVLDALVKISDTCIAEFHEVRVK